MTTPAALEDLNWFQDCANMLEAWAASGLPFTAEDLRRSMRTPPHCNSWGIAFRTASQAGTIAPIGFRESSEPSRRGGIIRVWTKGTTP